MNRDEEVMCSLVKCLFVVLTVKLGGNVFLETPRCLPVFLSGTVFWFRDVAGILRDC